MNILKFSLHPLWHTCVQGTACSLDYTSRLATVRNQIPKGSTSSTGWLPVGNEARIVHGSWDDLLLNIRKRSVRLQVLEFSTPNFKSGQIRFQQDSLPVGSHAVFL